MDENKRPEGLRYYVHFPESLKLHMVRIPKMERPVKGEVIKIEIPDVVKPYYIANEILNMNREFGIKIQLVGPVGDTHEEWRINVCGTRWMIENTSTPYMLMVVKDIDFSVYPKEIQPPLGLIRKHFYEEKKLNQRFNDVCGAISRYWDAGFKIPVEWIEEYNELIDKIKK